MILKLYYKKANVRESRMLSFINQFNVEIAQKILRRAATINNQRYFDPIHSMSQSHGIGPLMEQDGSLFFKISDQNHV